MDIEIIVSAIDEEIARLQSARALLSGMGGTASRRPAKGTTKSVAVTPREDATKRRRMSAKARKAIADAQHKRWAAFKAAKEKKTAAAKKAPAKAAAKISEAAPF